MEESRALKGVYLYGDGRIPSEFVRKNVLIELTDSLIKIYLANHSHGESIRATEDPLVDIPFSWVRSVDLKEGGPFDLPRRIELLYSYKKYQREVFEHRISISFDPNEDCLEIYQDILHRINNAKEKRHERTTQPKPDLPDDYYFDREREWEDDQRYTWENPYD